MKNLGKLLLCAGILFTTAACGSKEDPIDTKAIDKFEKVMTQTQHYKSANYNVDITANADGESVKAKVHGAFIANEQPQISMVLDLEAEDQPTTGPMTFYMFDNNIYVDLMGSKMKLAMDTAGALYGIDAPETDTSKDKKNSTDKKALKKILKSASMKDSKISMEFDTKKFLDYMNDGESVPASLSSQMDGVTINKFTVNTTYDKQNYLVGLKIVMNLSKKVDGVKVTTKTTINFTLKDRDKVETIDMPTDLDTYIDLATAMSGYGDPTLPDDTDTSLEDGL